MHRVKDDGTTGGIEDIDKASVFVSRIIANQIEPSPKGIVSIETQQSTASASSRLLPRRAMNSTTSRNTG